MYIYISFLRSAKLVLQLYVQLQVKRLRAAAVEKMFGQNGPLLIPPIKAVFRVHF